MTTKFFNIRKLIMVVVVGFFLFYAFLAGPYWLALFKFRSLSRSGVGYNVPGRLDDIPTEETMTIQPVSKKFSVVVPKLAINVSVARQVDFYDEKRVSSLLEGGAIHLEGSSLPSRLGPVVILAHSPDQLLNFSQLNPEFYLLKKLKPGDLIYVYFEEAEYRYEVTGSGVYPPNYFDFFDSTRERKLYLASGWPPGTSLRLLVVEAKAAWD